MKKIMTVLLALMLALALWGCGSEPAQEESTLPQLGEDTQTTPVLYTVKVTDENGMPVSGVIVQLCSDICVPGATDEEGIARLTLMPGDYKVSVTVMPQGYTYAGETTEFTFPEGSRELTIVLKAE